MMRAVWALARLFYNKPPLKASSANLYGRNHRSRVQVFSLGKPLITKTISLDDGRTRITRDIRQESKLSFVFIVNADLLMLRADPHQ